MIMMKVTILSNSKGGLFAVTMQWAAGLVRKGCNVNIFFLTQSRESNRLISSKHVHFYYFSNSFLIPNLRALVAFLVHDHPDVVHINFAWFGPLAIFKKLTFKTPFIYTLHGLPQPWLEPSLAHKIAYTIEHCLLHFVASQSSISVTISNYVRDTLKKKYGINSQVIYHGIEPDRFKPKNKTQNKRKLGYRETDFIILYVGKLHPYKDPLTLIKAISVALEKNANLHLAMIGDGELYTEVEKEISKPNLSNHIKLFRHVGNQTLEMLYDAADVLVLPSVNEAFGMVLLEAMASGLPVIASDSGACPEVIGNVGVLFNQGDYIDLAEKIIALSFDKGLSRKLAKAGLERVEENFSWKDKINQYYKLYEKIEKPVSKSLQRE
jgi:glycosyltransferase involved in cell wall biosynthesis